MTIRSTIVLAKRFGWLAVLVLDLPNRWTWWCFSSVSVSFFSSSNFLVSDGNRMNSIRIISVRIILKYMLYFFHLLYSYVIMILISWLFVTRKCFLKAQNFFGGWTLSNDISYELSVRFNDMFKHPESSIMLNRSRVWAFW